jgi:hypothetical protein
MLKVGARGLESGETRKLFTATVQLALLAKSTAVRRSTHPRGGVDPTLFRTASTNESETRSTEFLLVTSSTTIQIQAIANLKVPDDTPAQRTSCVVGPGSSKDSILGRLTRNP